VLAVTAEKNAREIQLVAAQDEIANPPARFKAQKIR
jgi:pyridoxal/pyridoxine/pyridoxamine kinase